jgi:16S rRNA (guanine527-N7)-methyltransferase
VLLLLQETNEYNLIGKSTINDIWNRHILDSAQLLKYIPDKNIKLADFGTGAGFPGMVLALLQIKEVHLVEKSFRKCEFLRKAKMLSTNRIFVHQAKLEELSDRKFDVITSRALASLDKLLAYSKKFLKNDGYAVFLKGKNLEQELQIAKTQFAFSYELFESLTSQESRIIKVSQISELSK